MFTRLVIAPLLLTVAAVASAQMPAGARPIAVATPSPTPQPGAFSPLRCTKLPAAMQMQGSAVIGNRLYTFGGASNQGGWLNDVISAEIRSDGTLGTWRNETPMPERRHYIGQSVEVVNDRIYIIAGTIAPTKDATEGQTRSTNDVLWTKVRPDGTLEEWRKSEPFPGTTRSQLATCSNDQHLYVLAGRAPAKTTTDDILVCDFDAQGAPVNWRAAGKTPTTLWFHAAAVLDNKLFVWGGLQTTENTSLNQRVFSTELRPDGTIGTWGEDTPMPVPSYSGTACGFNDHLITVAGRYNGGNPHNDIWFTKLKNGKIEKWQSLATDLDTRVYHSLGLDKSRGWIYIVGGRYRPSTNINQGNLVDTVAAFQVRGGGSSAAAASAPGAGRGLDQALQAAASSGKQVLVYFRSPEVPSCQRFEEQVMSLPAFKELQQSYEFAQVDTSKDSASSYKYSVFRVPSLLHLSKDGKVVKSSSRLQTLNDVNTFMAKN